MRFPLTRHSLCDALSGAVRQQRQTESGEAQRRARQPFSSEAKGS